MTRKINIVTTISADIVFSEEFIKLKADRKLSQFIERLLRESLAIVKESGDKTEESIKAELNRLDAKKSALMDKLEEYDKVKAEKEKYHKEMLAKGYELYDDGQYYKEIK